MKYVILQKGEGYRPFCLLTDEAEASPPAYVMVKAMFFCLLTDETEDTPPVHVSNASSSPDDFDCEVSFGLHVKFLDARFQGDSSIDLENLNIIFDYK